MAGCEVFEITLTRGYDEVMFREDLKQLYTMIGADNKKVLTLTLRLPLWLRAHESMQALGGKAESQCIYPRIYLELCES